MKEKNIKILVEEFRKKYHVGNKVFVQKEGEEKFEDEIQYPVLKNGTVFLLKNKLTEIKLIVD